MAAPSYLIKILLVEPVGDTHGGEDGADEERKREHECEDKTVGARGASPHHQPPAPAFAGAIVAASESRGKSRWGSRGEAVTSSSN